MGLLRKIYDIPFVTWVYSHVFNAYGEYIKWLVKRDRRKIEIDFSQKGKEILFLTVAFNNEKLIEEQIRRMKLFVEDLDYDYVVVDNSSAKEKRTAIETVCRAAGVEYVAVPAYIHQHIHTRTFWAGYSHGAALNWAMVHVVTPRNPKRLMLLDHDLMPMKPVNMTERLGDKDFFGALRKREGGWYLWPGFSLFRTDKLFDSKPNFMPIYIGRSYLDTGGSNYLRLFSKYYLNKLEFAIELTKRIQITPGLKDNSEIYHTDCIQQYDKSWVHLVNGSNYTRMKSKEAMLTRILADFKKK